MGDSRRRFRHSYLLHVYLDDIHVLPYYGVPESQTPTDSWDLRLITETDLQTIPDMCNPKIL